MNLGVDLGTSRIVIYDPNSGVLLDEPTVIAISQLDGHVVACGEEAKKMLGRAPNTIMVTRPITKGVIADYDLAEKMLRFFLAKVCSNRITKPCVAVSITEQITEVERRSFIEAVMSAGARRVTLVPETVASAIGAGMDVSLPNGQMLVNVGGGTIDVSVISLKGEAVSRSIRGAGTVMDEAVIRGVRAKYGLIIGQSMAEKAKIAIGSTLPLNEPLCFTVKGRDAVSGLPKSVEIDSDELCDMLRECLSNLASLVRQVLEITPPELAGDIMKNGIWLTGGAAQLRNLPQWLHSVTGVPCFLAENPAQCSAIGAGKALQYASAFSEIYDLGNYSYRLSDSITN